MRSAAFVTAAALLALTVAFGSLPRQTKADDTHPPAITDCAQELGAAVQGGNCTQASLDGTPGSIVSHTVLAGACGGRDLHLVRYLAGARLSDAPVVAMYCGG
jgi:hypothetical protein